MPPSFREIAERMKKSSSVLELEKEIDKQHIFEILKSIEKEANGISYSGLKEISRSGTTLKLSNTYLAAYLFWLKKQGYLSEYRRKKHLSEKGKKALLDLEEYLSPLETTFIADWNLSNKKAVKATLKGKIENITKTAIFSRQFIQERILELSAWLSFSSEDVDLNIRIPPVESKDVLSLLKVLWSFYWQKVSSQNTVSPFVGPLCIDMHLTSGESQKKYADYWRKHLEEYSKLRGTEWIDRTTANGEKGYSKPRTYPILPPELEGILSVLMEKSHVKRWIENQLEKNPNWFMPHTIWVDLGFKRQRIDLSFESVDNVSPPFFHDIKSPNLPQEYETFHAMFRYVIRKNDPKSLEAFHFWIVRNADWKSQGFYKSWRIIRRELKEKISGDPKLRDIGRILDEALSEYIVADHSPQVNLEIAFTDYLRLKSVDQVINGIEDKKYKITR